MISTPFPRCVLVLVLLLPSRRLLLVPPRLPLMRSDRVQHTSSHSQSVAAAAAAAAGNNAGDGLAVLGHMSALGFEARLIDSQVRRPRHRPTGRCRAPA